MIQIGAQQKAIGTGTEIKGEKVNAISNRKKNDSNK